MIEAALPGAAVEVSDETGTGDHLLAEVSAPQFEGLSRIDQHRLVKAAVNERFDDGTIHALSVKTSVARRLRLSADESFISRARVDFCLRWRHGADAMTWTNSHWTTSTGGERALQPGDRDGFAADGPDRSLTHAIFLVGSGLFAAFVAVLVAMITAA